MQPKPFCPSCPCQCLRPPTLWPPVLFHLPFFMNPSYWAKSFHIWCYIATMDHYYGNHHISIYYRPVNHLALWKGYLNNSVFLLIPHRWARTSFISNLIPFARLLLNTCSCPLRHSFPNHNNSLCKNNVSPYSLTTKVVLDFFQLNFIRIFLEHSKAFKAVRSK